VRVGSTRPKIKSFSCPAGKPVAMGLQTAGDRCNDATERPEEKAVAVDEITNWAAEAKPSRSWGDGEGSLPY